MKTRDRRRALGAGVLIALLWASAALAHAAYKGSDPADGATIPSPPNEVWAEYTEPPSSASHMEVFDPCGEQVDLGDSRSDAYKLYVSMSSDKAGTYRVTWFVNSAADSHSTRGEFKFTVSDGAACPGAAPKAPKEPRDKDRKDEPATSGTGGGSDPDTPVSSDSAGDSTGSGQHHHHDQGGRVAGSNQSGGRDRSDKGPDKDRGEDAAPAAINRPAPEQPGIFEDIPAGGALVALLMAAVIGAGGGLIYAGIMGYRS